MNKDVISRLTDQADEHAIDYVGSLRRQGIQVLPEYYEQAFRKKFAELIVRECMREADLPLRADGKYDHLLPSQMIAKHFAMEEQTSWS